MTVKELILLLECCNQNADVYVVTDSGTSELKDEDVFAEPNGGSVTIDISVASLAYKEK